MIRRLGIFTEIVNERRQQDAKWGEQNHPIREEHERAIAFYKEEAETFRKICDLKARGNRLTWYDIIIEEFFEAFAEDTPEGQRAELVQMVAVGVAMIECIDRRAGEASVVRLPPVEPIYVQQVGRVDREFRIATRRVRCNHCMSEFDEEYIDVNATDHDSGETCPACSKGDALMDLDPAPDNAEPGCGDVVAWRRISDGQVYVSSCYSKDQEPLSPNNWKCFILMRHDELERRIKAVRP